MNKFNLQSTSAPMEHGNLEVLEKFQFSNGRGFPNSYKQFVKQYGYGVTMDQFHIYIPMDDYGDSLDIRSKEIKSTYYEDVLKNDIWFDLEPDGTVALLKRMIPFASGTNGYYLFWDPDSQGFEFDIYLTDFRGSGFRKIGNSLFEAIDHLTCMDTYKKYLPFSSEPLPLTFKPLTKRG